MALFQAATWWRVVPCFEVHEPDFELQASYLQQGSHGAQAEGTEATLDMLPSWPSEGRVHLKLLLELCSFGQSKSHNKAQGNGVGRYNTPSRREVN